MEVRGHFTLKLRPFQGDTSLLRILLSEGKHSGHMEHDLSFLVFGVDGFQTRLSVLRI